MSDLDTRVLAPEIVDAEPVIVEFPEFRLPIWEKKEGAFQRRLARAGLPAPAIKLERFDKKVLKGGIELDVGTIFGASEVIEPWIRVELEEIRIVAGQVSDVLSAKFPVSWSALSGGHPEAHPPPAHSYYTNHPQSA